ncbi:MAG TPA: ester cyclase [Stellaceae bacterium]|nr:ester cyclase [Stellaceae bacterium]
MTNRRDMLALGILGGPALCAPLRAALAAGECRPAAASDAVGAALLDKYAAAVNAHDTSSFPEIHTESYIQHSGRSPSGLAAQIENFQRIFSVMPDLRMKVEDRIIAGDRVVARNTFSATHDHTVRGIPPTGKVFTFRTIDIWRVENGKFAEHWDLTDTAEVMRQLSGER